MTDSLHSTPTRDLHHLAGSSPPGAGAPAFEAVASTVADEDDDSFAASVEPDLSRFCGEDQVLIQTAKNISAGARRGKTSSDLRALVSTLADLKPRSLIALGMKADACIDCLTHLHDPSAVHQIGLSIWHDAMNLATASVCPPETTTEAPQESWAFRDAAFRWATATVECDGWYQMMTNIEKMVVDRGIPDALWVRPEDKEMFPGAHRMPDFDEKPWFGHPDTIVGLRATVEKGNSGPADCAARRLEILDTYDAWSRRSDNAKLVLAAADAFRRSLEFSDQLDLLRARVMQTPIQTADGLVVKTVVGSGSYSSLWASLAHLERTIETDENVLGVAPGVANYLHRDLLRMALGRGMSTWTLAGNQPKDVPAPTREQLESYRTFLHFELRELNLELDGDIRAKGFWLDNPAGNYHFGDNPKASTRASAVLGMFGLMPIPDAPEVGAHHATRAA